MQIIFENPRRITCDCGWYFDAEFDMTDSTARKIADEHIQEQHPNGYNKRREVIPYLSARDDLAAIIAAETFGHPGSIPIDEDFEMADKFIEMIKNRSK